MQITDAQKQTVKKWVDEGCGLSDIQKKLSTELGISMTYMDVRMLMLDLGMTVKDRPRPAPAAKTAPPLPARAAADGMAEDDDVAVPAPGPGGGVSVEVSRVAKPGSVVSGSVTFSDGMSASWSLDHSGRLGLMPGKPGYKPSEADIQAFQMELRDALSQKGF
mgnify:CR=1 FL=1